MFVGNWVLHPRQNQSNIPFHIQYCLRVTPEKNWFLKAVKTIFLALEVDVSKTGKFYT